MKDIGYCNNHNRTRKNDFADIMEALITSIPKGADCETLWEAAALPLRLYNLFVEELLLKGTATQLHLAIKYVFEESLRQKSHIPIEEITVTNGLLSSFPNGAERLLLVYACNLPGKVGCNSLFFASMQNIRIYLQIIEDLLDLLEKTNNQRSWIDRLESLLEPNKKAA